VDQLREVKHVNTKVVVIIVVVVAVVFVLAAVGAFIIYPHYTDQEKKKEKEEEPKVFPPIAKINASTTKAVVGDIITFNSSGSYDTDGVIILYTWDFGDSIHNETNSTQVTHSYQSPRNYTVNLTVQDDQLLIATTEITISIIPQNVPFEGNGIILSRENLLLPDKINKSFEKQPFEANFSMNLSLVGASLDLSAAVDFTIFDPHGAILFNRSYDFTGMKTDLVVLEPDEIRLDGKYDMLFVCTKGGVRVSYSGEIIYQ